MTSQYYAGRPGGSQQSPGPSGLVDAALALAMRLTWALAPVLVLAGLGIFAWLRLSTALAVLAVAVLTTTFIATAQWQWWHFYAVRLRGKLPRRFRQVGIVNRLGETPRVVSVRRRGQILTIKCSTRDGHSLALFKQHAAELAGPLDAISVVLEQNKSRVTLTAILKSAHDQEFAQSWM